MNLTLRIWRQSGPRVRGRLVKYPVTDIAPDMSFLEMLDVLNEDLIERDDEPVAFDHDCREGICGACSLTVDGVPHGPWEASTVCQLHMRAYKDGDVITIEPFRAGAFPVIKDLMVDRSALDRVIQAGGYISASTGGAQDANALPIPKLDADQAMDAAACIGCGACVAACPNASASLFVAAKLAHLARLPQGQPERRERTRRMIAQMEIEGFGLCSNHYECEATCPKAISVDTIAAMNRDFVTASVKK